MNVKLLPISQNDKSVLTNIFQLYMYDLTRFLSISLNEHGLYNYRFIDYYWTDENYIPYFIMVDDNIAGFVLINNGFMILDQKEGNYNMSEFFVLNSYRKKGIGKKAAYMIFDKYKGDWEIKPIPKSEEAKLFWESIIKEYTNNNYEIKHPKPTRLAFVFSSENK